MGELKRIDGADWDLEIGTMAELIYRERTGTIPALLFDQIKGYPKGFRILFGQQTSYSRLALMAGLPMDSVGLKLVSRFKEKLNKLQPIAPRVVKTGPVFENVMVGDDIDILKFPCRKFMSSMAADLSGRRASLSPAIRKKAGSISAPIAPWYMTKNL